MPQELSWSGWDSSEPLEEAAVVLADQRLGRFLRPAAQPGAALPAVARAGAVVGAAARQTTKSSNPVAPIAGELPRPAPDVVAGAAAPATVAGAALAAVAAVDTDIAPVDAGDLVSASIRAQEEHVEREGNPFADLPDDDM
jgi:hypothetical protein